MKKNYLLLIIALIGFGSQAQIVNIPDADFKNMLISAGIDSNGNGQIEVSEAQATTELSLVGFSSGITDITGLEAFSNLTTLMFILNIPSLDVTALTQLESLNCSGSGIHNLNVTGLSNLRFLDCSSNFESLTTLDLTGCVALETLDCNNTHLTALDVSVGNNLKSLICSDSDHISSLNLSGQTNLEYLDCRSNPLMTLDISDNLNLKTLRCNFNQLSALDVSQHIALEYLECSYNTIGVLDVSNLTALEKLICNNNTISTLDVSDLVNLTELNCKNNSIAVLDVAALTSLDKLTCSNNQIGVLDLSALNNLTQLYCDENNISSLNLGNVPDLTTLICANNTIASLDLSSVPLLTGLNCRSNLLTTLDISNLQQLGGLDCTDNQLTTLSIVGHPELHNISCGGNLLTELDLSLFTPLETTYPNAIEIDDSPNLVTVSTKNNGADGESVFASNCPNLHYICADEFEIGFINYYLANQNINTIQVNSYCTFEPGGDHNTISGTVTVDLDNNGCTPADGFFDNIKIKIQDGTQTGATFTNASSNYEFYTEGGSFTITPIFENNYFTITPASAVVNFANANNNTSVQNFCIAPNGIHNDLEIVLHGGQAQPGFDTSYYLTFKNKGNQIQSGTINLAFEDDVLDFVSAAPMTVSQSPNNLSWDYTNLAPFESRTITFILNANGPMEIPPLNIDDLLDFTATINDIPGDETPLDNIFDLQQTVVGSFDPNDKTCLEGSTITPERVGDYLHYLIRFQNSGTAPAVNIVVKDMIDTSKFEVASLQLIGSSHPQVTKIENNKVEFFFENINLPAEQDNEPGSHGFVAFKIKTKSNLVIGNTITNRADIFFDYNFPISTNTTNTTVAVLGTDEFEDTSVLVYPNPAKNVLNISARENIKAIQVFDFQGRLMQASVENNTEASVDLGNQSSGVYFVKVHTEMGVGIQKIIKE